jgi:hypothetical protein
MSRVRERYNIALPLRTIFEAPTLAAFASRIETMLWASRNVESVRDSSQAREEIEL